MELSYEFIPSEYGMFEFRIERNRPVRTGTYTQLTVETTADIVDVAFQHSFLLALVVGHGL